MQLLTDVACLTVQRKDMTPSVAEIISRDPLSWIDRSYLPASVSGLTGVQKAMLNSMINRKFSLTPLGDDVLDDPEVRFVCLNWFHIRQAAFLMACHRYRSAIRQSKTIHSLDTKARVFMDLNWSGESARQQKYTHTINIVSLARDEMQPYLKELPHGISERLSLLFPHTVEKQPSAPFDKLLFIMALTHAKTYSV